MADQFPGLYSDADPADIPDGASTNQDNIQSFIPGRLSVRKGVGRQSELMDTTGEFGADDLIAIYKYPHANGDFVITADKSGRVKTRRSNIINTIATDRFNDALWSFARDRRGSLIGVNGRERGFYWDSETDDVDELGVDGPTSPPSVTLLVGAGSLSAGDYRCYYRYVAAPLDAPAYSVLSPVKTITAAASDLLLWSGAVASTQDRVLKIQYWRTAAGGSNVLYLVGEAGQQNAITTFANGGAGETVVTFERRHSFLLGQQVQISGSTGDDGNYEVLLVVDDENIIVDHTWSTATPGPTAVAFSYGLSNDGTSDQDLIDAAEADPANRLLIVDSAGNPVAGRFVVPPDWKHSITNFQDRLFFAGDNIDGVDEITTTVDSTTVTFTTANSMPGNSVGSVMWIPTSTGTQKFTVESIDSTTEVSVYPPVPEAITTTEYSIRPPETERNTIYYSEVDEPESVPRINKITVQEQSEDEDEIVGVHSFGAYLYILKQRHIYSFSFARQPRIDGQARLITHRGAFNKNCWAVYEGQTYVMDQSGAYILGLNGDFRPISDPVQDLFREATVDFSKSKWFFVSVDYNSSIVRFHVAFTNDTGQRPRRAICFSIRHQSWWTESYPFTLAGSAMAIVDDRPQMLCGGQADMVVNLEKQESEVVPEEIRGTVTSATSTEVTDDSAAFTEEVVGAPIAILTGDGRCQVRTILERVSGTTVRVGTPTGFDQLETQSGDLLFFQDGSPWEVQGSGTGSGTGDLGSEWDVIPEAGDEYMIGAIVWVYQSKEYALADLEDRTPHHLDVDYRPTTGDYAFDVSLFFDEEESPDVNSLSHDQGVGVLAERGDNYHTIQMRRDYPARGIRVGTNRISFNNRIDSRMQSHREVSFQLKGIKGEEKVFIDSIEFSAKK